MLASRLASVGARSHLAWAPMRRSREAMRRGSSKPLFHTTLSASTGARSLTSSPSFRSRVDGRGRSGNAERRRVCAMRSCARRIYPSGRMWCFCASRRDASAEATSERAYARACKSTFAVFEKKRPFTVSRLSVAFPVAETRLCSLLFVGPSYLKSERNAPKREN